MGRIFRIGVATLFGTTLIAAALFFGRATPPAADAGAGVVVGTFTREYQETKDTDGDGMRDWEEELRGRNPLVADSPATAAVVTATEPEVPYVAPTTITGKFGQNFFKGYVEQGGGSMSEEEKAEFVHASVSSIVDASNERPLTRADISIGADSGLDAARTYGNTAGEILSRTFASGGDDPLVTLRDALREKDENLLSSLTLTRDRYQLLTNELLATPVPPSLIAEHLALVNITNALLWDTEGMLMAFEDPLRALVDAKEYQSDFESMFSALDNVRRALEESDVVYTSDEWGMFFFSLRP